MGDTNEDTHTERYLDAWATPDYVTLDATIRNWIDKFD